MKKNDLLCEIVPNLFIGNIDDANDIEKIKKNDIKGILNCAIECQNRIYGNVEIYKLGLKDDLDENLNNHLDAALDYINKFVRNEKNILVHCHKGRSRSVAVVIAYIMKYGNDRSYLSIKQAINIIKREYDLFLINPSFMEQ